MTSNVRGAGRFDLFPTYWVIARDMRSFLVFQRLLLLDSLCAVFLEWMKPCLVRVIALVATWSFLHFKRLSVSITPNNSFITHSIQKFTYEYLV